MSARWWWRSTSDSANRARWSPRTGPSSRSALEHAVDRLVGAVAEPAQRSQGAHVADDREGRGIHVQLVAQGGEDGIGHLGWVRRGGQGPGHGLHALGGLRGHPPATLVPRLGVSRGQLHVALPPQVGHVHRHRGCGQLGHHAENVIQLSVVMGRRADDEGEEGGQQSDQGDSPGAGVERGDEGTNGEQTHGRDVPARHREEDGHTGDPNQGGQGGNGFGAVRPQAAQPGGSLLVSLFGHCAGGPRSRTRGAERYVVSRRGSPHCVADPRLPGIPLGLFAPGQPWVHPYKPWETGRVYVVMGRTSEIEANHRCMTSGIALQAPW